MNPAAIADRTDQGRAPAPLDIVLVEFLPSGGMFQFAFQFAEALAKAGHRVRLLTGPDPELTSNTENLQIVPLLPTWHPNSESVGPAWLRKLRRVGRAFRLIESWRRVLLDLRRRRPDVAQFGELRYALDTAAFWLAARFGRAKLMVDVAHNPVPYDVNSRSQDVEKSGRLTRWLLAKAYAACDLVLVLGEGPRTDLLNHFPQVRRVEVCGHGDYSSVLRSSDLPSPGQAPPRALLFGSWTKYKNIPLLLDAFALVRHQLPAAGLTLAGPVMPDVDYESIEARAADIGNVELRPGYVPMDELPVLFGEHRVVMFTYQTVNISGSVHMAYTFGRPVVATRVGSMTDVVRDGVTGYLADPDAESVARAMLGILDDPATAERFGAAAAEHAQRSSSWSSVAEKAVAAYAG